MAALRDRFVRRLTPGRRRGYEVLDGPGVEQSLRRRSHRDIAVANRWLGGSRALAAALRAALAAAEARPVRVLDVGTGSGETLELVLREGKRVGVETDRIALDLDEPLARAGATRGHAVCASALDLPFADRSVDVTVCSLLLHHFTEGALAQAIAELDRVTRGQVIVHDLRRSWVAVAGLWLASFPLAFHPVSRHDGVTSILRGFTRDELSALVEQMTGVVPCVTKWMGYRLIATWSPEPCPTD